MSSWFKFGDRENEDRRFIAFDEKTIDEQADDITSALIFDEENPLFIFDKKDYFERREFQKSLVGCTMTLSLVTYIDLRVLNGTQYGRAMGPLRKFFALNILNIPIYWYFYHDLNQKYMDLKKHLVKRYLIEGDEILYKRRLN